MSITDRCDVAVVGGGTAGALIAGQLAMRSSRSVQLIEEGSDEVHPLSRRLADQPQILRSGPLRRMPERRPEGGGATLLSGRVLGGGWAVNHGVMMMPSPVDLDAIAVAGGAGWSVELLRGLAERIVTDLDRTAAGAPHVGTGPVPLARPFLDVANASPATAALLRACERAGVPWSSDVNRDVAEVNVSSYAYSSDGGERVTSVTAFLDPARSRSGLRVVVRTFVRRLIVEGSRVVALEVAQADAVGGSARRIEADRIVLCAGAFHTPQILLRSGIGPVDHLEACGIEVALASPGVGLGLRDHAKYEPELVLTPRPEDRPSGGEPWADDPFGDRNKVHLRLRSALAGDEPDLDLQLRHDVAAGVAVLTVRILEQRAPGTVRLDPDDPSGLPCIDSGMLRHEDDVKVLVEGVMRGVALLEDPMLGGRYRLPEGSPRTEAGWREAVLRGYGSYNHGVGTCRMGRDEASVVDEGLRVRGIDNLFIADASVLPALPHVTTNFPVAIVAQWAADRLLATD